jgi:hypothetical protein
VLESCAKDVAHNGLVFGRFQRVAHRPIDGEWATVGAIELALLFFAERWIVLGYLAAARNGIAVVSGDATLVVLRWAGEAARVEARALLAAAGRRVTGLTCLADLLVQPILLLTDARLLHALNPVALAVVEDLTRHISIYSNMVVMRVVVSVHMVAVRMIVDMDMIVVSVWMGSASGLIDRWWSFRLPMSIIKVAKDDHIHIHDHAHGHHMHADHHPHHHHIAVDGDMSGEVLHHCESDGIEGVEQACICQQENGLYQQICETGEPCDTSTGRCQQRSCFDACRFASPAQDDESSVARNNCYTVTCGCEIPQDDPPLSEEEKCQLDCADCGPFPVDWPMSNALKAAKHETVMRDIFGTGLEHASDYNVRSMRRLETLSHILF